MSEINEAVKRGIEALEKFMRTGDQNQFVMMRRVLDALPEPESLKLRPGACKTCGEYYMNCGCNSFVPQDGTEPSPEPECSCDVAGIRLGEAEPCDKCKPSPDYKQLYEKKLAEALDIIEQIRLYYVKSGLVQAPHFYSDSLGDLKRLSKARKHLGE